MLANPTQTQANLALPLTCIYENEMSYPQVVRIENIAGFSLERCVMPGQRLVFEAPVGAQLRLLSCDTCRLVYEDTLTCESLVPHPITTLIARLSQEFSG